MERGYRLNLRGDLFESMQFIKDDGVVDGDRVLSDSQQYSSGVNLFK